MPTVEEGTFGALFHARPQEEGRAADLAEIVERGFTILETRDFAGRTDVWGYGDYIAIDGVLTDFEFKQRVPSFFIQLPAGEELTLSLIQQWADVDSVIRQ